MNWKKFGSKLIFPPVWIMIVLAVLSTATLVFVFVKGAGESPVAYMAYVLAFYTLSVICVFFGMVLPKRYRSIKQKIYDNPLGNRYLTDAVFRTNISLYLSLVINLLYVCVNAFFFVLYRSVWFLVLACYYSILAVMRFLLARYSRKHGIGNNRIGELKRVTLCSSILLTVNFSLSGAILMILYQDRGFEYHGMLIYIMAAFTFYLTTHAIVDLVKYRKYNSPVVIMTKVIALSAALVSVILLETAMFSRFGQDITPENKRLIIALTGAGVIITVVIMSLYMIIKSAVEISKSRGDKNGK